MKKLIVFLVILLISSKTFSQTDTSKDSLICLPKSLVTKTVQDLTKCDGERQEMIILKENLQLMDDYVQKQDGIILEQEKKIADYKTAMLAYSQIDTAHVNIVNATNEKANVYRKERNWYRIAAVILLIVTLVK